MNFRISGLKKSADGQQLNTQDKSFRFIYLEFQFAKFRALMQISKEKVGSNPETLTHVTYHSDSKGNILQLTKKNRLLPVLYSVCLRILRLFYSNF